jgi:hypothetical protein
VVTEADETPAGPGSARTGDSSLLLDLVDAFVAEPLASPFLSSMASCLDCYLRVATSADRFFLSRRGLLAHVLRGLLDESTPTKSTDARERSANNQSFFDLLAELIRFCPPALAMLDAQLTGDRLDALMHAVRANLVCVCV